MICDRCKFVAHNGYPWCVSVQVEGVPVTHLIIEVSLILALIITVLWPKKKSHGSNDDLTKEVSF